MKESAKDRMTFIMKAIEALHPQLSKFAQNSFGVHGRGVTLTSVPSLPPAPTAFVSTEMVYHSLEQIRELMADIDDQVGAAAMIRIIETYDPTKHAVVTVAVGNEHPFTAKVRLDEPYLAE